MNYPFLDVSSNVEEIITNYENIEEIRFELYLNCSFHLSNQPLLIYSKTPFSDNIINEIKNDITFNL